jgi:hypothetical protein
MMLTSPLPETRTKKSTGGEGQRVAVTKPNPTNKRGMDERWKCNGWKMGKARPSQARKEQYELQ